MDKTLYSYFLDYLSYIKQFNTDTVVLKKKQKQNKQKKTFSSWYKFIMTSHLEVALYTKLLSQLEPGKKYKAIKMF